MYVDKQRLRMLKKSSNMSWISIKFEGITRDEFDSCIVAAGLVLHSFSNILYSKRLLLLLYYFAFLCQNDTDFTYSKSEFRNVLMLRNFVISCSLSKNSIYVNSVLNFSPIKNNYADMFGHLALHFGLFLCVRY